ncbi:MAG: response regulator transcription factor [bacterium]|nr:response regulator transcription factor [bacterium]
MLKIITVTGLVLGGSVVLLSVLRHQLTMQTDSVELYAFAVAVLFTAYGVFIGRRASDASAQFQHPRTSGFNAQASGLSARELEVLALLTDGLSNQEIADRLFVSMNTVKTHLSSIYSKMNVRRRTEAVKRANEMGLTLNHPIG